MWSARAISASLTATIRRCSPGESVVPCRRSCAAWWIDGASRSATIPSLFASRKIARAEISQAMTATALAPDRPSRRAAQRSNRRQAAKSASGPDPAQGRGPGEPGRPRRVQGHGPVAPEPGGGHARPVAGEHPGLLQGQRRLVGVLPAGMGHQHLHAAPWGTGVMRPGRAAGTAAAARACSRAAAATASRSSRTTSIRRPAKNQ